LSNKLNLPTNLWSFLWHFIKRQKAAFAIATIVMFAWSLEESCYPYFIKLIIDKIEAYPGHKDKLFAYLTPTLILSSVVFLFIQVNYRIFDVVSSKLYPKFMVDIRGYIHEYILGHSHEYFSNNFSGTISTRIFKMPEAAQRIVDLFITLFFPVTLSIILSCLFVAVSDPLLALIILLWFVLYMGVTLSFSGKSSSLSIAHSKILNALNGKALDCLNNIINVKIFSNHQFEKKYFHQQQEEELSSFIIAMRFNVFIKLIQAIITIVFSFATIFISIYCYKNSIISLGDLTMILSYQGLIKIVWFMGMETVPFFDLIGNCKEALTILNKPHDIIDVKDAKEMIVTKGEIEFSNVTFNYIRNENVFKNKSIKIESLQKVGLAGFSGSGKSTFVNLILRYFDISEGNIYIDGQDIAKVKQDSLRRNISIIPQDSLLFHRTIMENIRYGRPEASDEEVIRAAKQAHAHEFIMKMPEQYHSLAGERGVKISGGQKQRIAISRAILKNAPILILDEATSSLDSITEAEIQISLKTLMKEKTAIIVAHRLSTLIEMDRIFVFDKGSIVESGTHMELISDRSTHYARLWGMQSDNLIV
jgi:ATP-binding cassette subfamily B protein